MRLMQNEILRLFINADLVASDKDGNPILLVDVRTSTMHPGVSTQVLESLKTANGKIPFAILANREAVSVWKAEEGIDPQQVLQFNTAEILSPYEPNFAEKQIFHTYFVTLVESWISDLIDHWKTKYPPKEKELTEIGLLDLLRDGVNEREVESLDLVR